MNRLKNVLIGFVLAGGLFSHAAIADHAAIVYCALDGNGGIVVVAADYSLGGGVSSSARSGRSCAAVLHEILRSGYEIAKMDAPQVARPAVGKDAASGSGASNGKSIPESPNGLIVFVLEKTHK
jgi:hypothetical protein